MLIFNKQLSQKKKQLLQNAEYTCPTMLHYKGQVYTRGFRKVYSELKKTIYF